MKHNEQNRNRDCNRDRRAAKNVKELLEKFATFVGVPFETLLVNQLEPDIEGFYQNDMFGAWAKCAITNAGCAEYFHLPKVREDETE